ncbi:MAG TPA: sugar ABC transporter permease, partial [Devosia sp.]|nr:sugar ABC transporter permease [Devosia sp.]
MTSPTITMAAPTRTRRRARMGQWQGLLYIAPAMALVIVFFVIPVLFTFWMSFHDWPL